jgi:hypothetical protein
MAAFALTMRRLRRWWYLRTLNSRVAQLETLIQQIEAEEARLAEQSLIFWTALDALEAELDAVHAAATAPAPLAPLGWGQ